MEDTASERAKLEVIHHMDSVLGVAITLAIFVLNLTQLSTSEYALDLGISVTISVLWALVGILRQKWNLKLFAW